MRKIEIRNSKSNLPILLGLLLVLAAGCRSPGPDPEKPYRRAHPPDVARSVSPTRSFDHRPYEFIWDPRPPARIPLVDFDLVIDWTATADAGVEVDFTRSQDEQLWGAYTGRIHFRAPARAGTGLQVRPPEPVRIPGRFDRAELWILGPGAGCGTSASPDGPELVLLVRDADEHVFEIPLGALTWGGWEIVNQRVPGDLVEAMRYPVAFDGFRLDDLPVGQEGTIFVDGLAFYVEQLYPLALEPRPARNLALWPGLSPGLHRGDPPLPFPVSEDTVIPPTAENGLRTRVEESALYLYDFTCEADDWSLRYRLDLNNPAQPLSMSWNEVPAGNIAGGGRILGRQPVLGQPLLARLEDGRVRVEFGGGAVYVFGLSGRSLVVDVYSRREDAEGFSLGRYHGPLRYTALAVPGLDAESNPWTAVGVLTGASESGLPPLFMSSTLDWYRSEASEVRAAADQSLDGALVQTLYRPDTAGERNDLYERAVLTVSPRMEDVLPNLAQPPARRASALVDRIWADPEGPLDYGTMLDTTRLLAGYGVTNVVQGHRVSCWRDGNESCTLRTRAAPGRGGDEALATFVAGQQELGWRVGLPASPFAIHGLSPFWAIDRVRRSPDGNLGREPDGHFGVKAPVAVTLQADIASQVAAKFKPGLACVLDLGSNPPWVHTDYDARVPGAGKFSQVYYSAGELLLAEGDAIDGPVVCRGGAEAYYAGLADGYLAAPSTRPVRPFLPVFYLTRVNPLACGFGVGRPAPTVLADEAPDREVDAWLADQIAYGRAGRLVPASAGLLCQGRSYYMMRELQSRYLLKPPLRIAYWDGQAMVSTSDAITRGALARSQIYLHYAGDLEVWVNGSTNLAWEVRVGRDTWVLPPSGWVASAPDFLEVSTLVDGGRLDYVKTPDSLYYDGRGRELPFRGWASTGPLAARFLGDADRPVLEVLDLGGSGRFSLPREDRIPVQIQVLDLHDREPSGSASFTAGDGLVDVQGPPGPHLYRVTLADPPAEVPSPEARLKGAPLDKGDGQGPPFGVRMEGSQVKRLTMGES